VQLTTEGRGAYNCVREQLSTKPGDLILFSPDALYDYRRAADNSVWEVEWVYFPQQPQWLDLLRWPEVGPGIHRVHAAGADYDRLRGLFTEIYEIHLAEPPLSQRLVSNLLEQLLIRCSQLAPVARNPPTDKRVLKAMDMIARRFAENFTVEELAAGCGMSAPRLAALFRRQTGMTIKQWRDERRMARATQLLVQTASPITRVAQDVGYGDSLYFSRCFNSRFGCSPRAWREQRLRDREFEPLARN
jgi:AraC family transcriptional regulator of arabinose operon